jgi:hypothetical protein
VKGLLAILIVLTSSAVAADFKLGKVVEIHDASALAEAAVANHPALAQGSGAATTSVPSQDLRCELTVTLDGTNYTAIFREDQHFKITDFNPGDQIHVRIEGKKLVVQRLDGKEMKSKIIRQEAAETAGPKS